MYGMNTRGLPGTLAPIYQELQVERSEAPATSRTCVTQFSSASACASMRLSPFSRQIPDAIGHPFNVLLDRREHVSEHRGAAGSGDREEVGEAGDADAE